MDVVQEARQRVGCDLDLVKTVTVQPEWCEQPVKVYQFATRGHPWPEIDRCFCWQVTDPVGRPHFRHVLGGQDGPIRTPEDALRYDQLSPRAPHS